MHAEVLYVTADSAVGANPFASHPLALDAHAALNPTDLLRNFNSELDNACARLLSEGADSALSLIHI